MIAFAALVALVALLVVADLRDPRLDAHEAARQLVRDRNLDEPYRCKRDEADETVTITMGDSDYFCAPVHNDPGDVSYWIGTDGKRITGYKQTAP